jgi:hypothetical protein
LFRGKERDDGESATTSTWSVWGRRTRCCSSRTRELLLSALVRAGVGSSYLALDASSGASTHASKESWAVSRFLPRSDLPSAAVIFPTYGSHRTLATTSPPPKDPTPPPKVFRPHLHQRHRRQPRRPHLRWGLSLASPRTLRPAASSPSPARSAVWSSSCLHRERNGRRKKHPMHRFVTDASNVK